MPASEKHRTETQVLSTIREAFKTAHAIIGIDGEKNHYAGMVADILQHKELTVSVNVPFPVFYKSHKFDVGFYADLLVNDIILICIRESPVDTAFEESVVLNYLRHTERRAGLFVYFGLESGPQILEKLNPAFCAS